MKLIEDWRRVLRRAWSIRMILLAGFFSGLEVAVPFLETLVPLPRGVFALLAFVATNAAFVTRLMAQKEVGHADDR